MFYRGQSQCCSCTDTSSNCNADSLDSAFSYLYPDADIANNHYLGFHTCGRFYSDGPSIFTKHRVLGRAKHHRKSQYHLDHRGIFSQPFFVPVLRGSVGLYHSPGDSINTPSAAAFATLPCHSRVERGSCCGRRAGRFRSSRSPRRSGHIPIPPPAFPVQSFPEAPLGLLDAAATQDV